MRAVIGFALSPSCLQLRANNVVKRPPVPIGRRLEECYYLVMDCFRLPETQQTQYGIIGGNIGWYARSKGCLQVSS